MLACGIAGALTACPAEPSDSARTNPPPPAPPSVRDASAAKQTPDRSVMSQAIDALAKATGTDPARIAVERVESVEWPDSSLGCPKPGQMYMQVITPGHRVTLRSANGVHRVHTGGGQAVVCPAKKE